MYDAVLIEQLLRRSVCSKELALCIMSATMIAYLNGAETMGKERQPDMNSWTGRMKEWGGGDFTFLSSDGESLTFIVVGLPQQITSNYKGKPQERIGCPVITDTGYQLFVCGKRVARKLAKFEGQFDKTAFMVVRHGAEGDINAKYDVKSLPETETYSALLKIKASDFTDDMIAESVKAASEVMQG